jgi:lysophospholipase L1-like esterase
VLTAGPELGRRARYVAVKAAYGGGTFGGIVGLTYALLVTEAKLARKTIGVPTTQAPKAARSYGRGRRGEQPVHLAVLGDSAAAGLGCALPEQTPGALLAGGVARDLRRRVDLTVVARVGARSADLEVQVAQVLKRRVDAAVIVIGANDVTHRVPLASSTRDLRRAVQTLRDAGAVVVVGTTPDLGSVKPLLQPLRTIAAHLSRRLAAAQTVATVEAGGTAVSLGDLLARTSTSSRSCGATTASTRRPRATAASSTRCCRRPAEPGRRHPRQRPHQRHGAGRRARGPRRLARARGRGRPAARAGRGRSPRPAAAPAPARRPRRPGRTDQPGRPRDGVRAGAGGSVRRPGRRAGLGARLERRSVCAVRCGARTPQTEELPCPKPSSSRPPAPPSGAPSRAR